MELLWASASTLLFNSFSIPDNTRHDEWVIYEETQPLMTSTHKHTRNHVSLTNKTVYCQTVHPELKIDQLQLLRLSKWNSQTFFAAKENKNDYHNFC